MESNQDILKRFERQMRFEWADNTANSYIKTVNKLLNFANGIDFKDITYKQCIEFIEELYTKCDRFGNPTNEENTATTINQRITALNKFFGYCHEKDFVGFETPYHFNHLKDKGKSNRKKEQDEKQMSLDLRQQILDINENYFKSHMSDRNIKDRAILCLLFRCGLRRSEVARITHDDIIVSDDEFEIEINNAKGNKYRSVFLSIDLYDTINDWIIVKKKNGWDCKYLLCTWNNKPIFNEESGRESDLIWNVIKKCSLRAGNKLGIKNLSFTPHQVRHAFATYMVGEGYSYEEVAQYMGNTPEVLRKVYFHGFDKKKMSKLGMTASA